MSDDEFWAELEQIETQSVPHLGGGGFATDEDEVLEGVFETLDQSQQREFLKPILAHQACVDAESFIHDADPDFEDFPGTRYHLHVIRRSHYWVSVAHLGPDMALTEWYEDQFCYWVRRLGYGHLLRPKGEDRVCWQKEGF